MTIRYLMAAAAAAFAIAMPSYADAPHPRTMSPVQAAGVLSEVLRAAGTEVLINDACPEGVYGSYQLMKDDNGRVIRDRVVLCRGNGAIDWTNSLSVLETLQHEATHAAQACARGPLFPPYFHSRMRRSIPLEDQRSLEKYGKAELPTEIEAFYFENQNAEMVIQLVLKACDRQINAQRNLS